MFVQRIGQRNYNSNVHFGIKFKNNESFEKLVNGCAEYSRKVVQGENLQSYEYWLTLECLEQNLKILSRQNVGDVITLEMGKMEIKAKPVTKKVSQKSKRADVVEDELDQILYSRFLYKDNKIENEILKNNLIYSTINAISELVHGNTLAKLLNKPLKNTPIYEQKEINKIIKEFTI